MSGLRKAVFKDYAVPDELGEKRGELGRSPGRALLSL